MEIHHTAETALPPGSVFHAGRSYSLESVYRAAGIDVALKVHREPLPLPAHGAVFDPAQLHDFMVRYRREAREAWHAHVLIVPTIAYRMGGRWSLPVGLMYDKMWGPNGSPREGCAIAYRTVRDLGERAYLRTVCHELGHVFNLQHPGDEQPPRPVGATIMNETRHLQMHPAFPENVAFQIDSANAEWLRSGPADYVRPGGRAPFGARPGAGLSGQSEPGDLGLRISTRRRDYWLGEPIYLRFTLENRGRAPAEVASPLSLHNRSISLSIRDPRGRAGEFRPAYVECGGNSLVALASGGRMLGNCLISHGAGVEFDEPGAYALRASYGTSIGGAPGSTVVSEEHSIEIRKPVSRRAVELADVSSLPESGLFLVLKGGRRMRGARDGWSRVVAADEGAPYASAIKTVLAQAELSAHGGRSAARRVLALLKTVRRGDLDLEQRADLAAAMGAAAVRLGRTGTAKEAAAELSDVGKELGTWPEGEVLEAGA